MSFGKLLGPRAFFVILYMCLSNSATLNADKLLTLHMSWSWQEWTKQIGWKVPLYDVLLLACCLPTLSSFQSSAFHSSSFFCPPPCAKLSRNTPEVHWMKPQHQPCSRNWSLLGGVIFWHKQIERKVPFGKAGWHALATA